MALTKLALTLLGTIGLTAGTVLAVAEPTAEPLPASVAKASSCGKCSKAAAACGKDACTTTPVSVTAATCKKDTCSKQACTQKTVAKAACDKAACDKAACDKAACDKAACTEAVSVKNACSKTEACSKKQCESQVSLNQACEGASACGKTQAKACAGDAKVAACGKTPCKTQPVSTTACAKKSDGEKTACAKEKCTDAVSTTADCEKSKCSEAVSTNAACSKSKCTETVAATAKCESAKCGTSKCTEAVSAQAECEASKCTKAVSVKAGCDKSKCSEAVSTKAACSKSKCTEAVAATTKCESEKCGTAKCTESVSTKADCDKTKCMEAVSTKACAKDACAAKTCSKACSTECDKECCGKCEGKCEKCPCKAKSDCDKNENVVDAEACRPEMTVGAGVNHNSGVVGNVVLAARVEAGTCESGANGQCQGHTVYGIDFSGMKPSIQRRTVYVANCSRCRAARDEHTDHDIVATSCEAKPACITSACPVSSCLAEASADCDCSVCVYDDCRGECGCAERELARNSEPASAACSSCDQCRCGACACDGAAMHAGISRVGVSHVGEYPGVAHVGHFRFEHFAPGAGTVFGWSSQGMGDGPQGPYAPPAGWTPSQDGYGHDMVHFNPEQELPGRIRLTTVMPQMFPGRPHLPPAMPFQMPHPGMAMSSFGMPVSTAMPERRPEREVASGSVEGTWSRTIGDETVVFTCENGRLTGRMEGGSLEFSGTCSVSEDGQIFGLIDNIEAPGVPGKFTSWLVDQPFAVRFRLDGGDLIVKDFRCADLPTTIEHGDDEIPVGDAVRSFVCGRFTRGEHGTH